MCELNVSKYVRKRMKKKRRKKKSASNNTRVWLVVMMMMVCEHKVHTWSVSCPSSFFSLLRCPLRPFTYTHTPSHHHQLRTLIRIFFYSHTRAQAAGHSAKARLFFSFLSLFFFFSSFSLCYATLWSNTTSSKSATTVFQSKERKRKTKMACLHNHV